LERFGLADAAREQYELALKFNSQLAEGEPKRMSSAQEAELEERVARLNNSHGR
jgi:hypothetical protein